MPKGPTRRAPGPAKDDSRKIVAQNRRARHDYEILDSVEAGIVLVGSEVKSLREGKAQIREAYARIDDGEMWLFGAHIPPWIHSAGFGAHDPERKRKLLLHRRELISIANRVNQDGLVLVPMSIYFKDGRAKAEIAIARGRHTYDKRRALAERDAARDAERAFADH
jgi:SsrA-binding protein